MILQEPFASFSDYDEPPTLFDRRGVTCDDEMAGQWITDNLWTLLPRRRLSPDDRDLYSHPTTAHVLSGIKGARQVKQPARVTFPCPRGILPKGINWMCSWNSKDLFLPPSNPCNSTWETGNGLQASCCLNRGSFSSRSRAPASRDRKTSTPPSLQCPPSC